MQSVWDPLVAAGRRLGNITADIDQRFAWQPFLVRDPSVNAFALPGGFVGVHLGLIAITVTRDELASVLGARAVARRRSGTSRAASPGSSRRSLVSLAALIIGLLAASRSNSPDAINAVVAGTQAATIQGQLNFSRDMEREADRIGFQVMVAAGFAPGGMAAMFEKMDASTRLNDYGGFPYLRTHPLTVERIGEARSRASMSVAGPPGQRPRAHGGAGARAGADGQARRCAAPLAGARRRWRRRRRRQAAQPLRERPGVDPAARLGARRRRLRQGAGDHPRQPEQQRRAERAVVLTAGAVAARSRRAGQGEGGDARPTPATGSRPVMLLAAQVALAEVAAVTADSAELKARASDLQTWVALHPDDSLAWGALGQTWGRLGLPLRALRAEAESRYSLGDLLGAVDRLRAAQRVARSGGPVDFIDASVIDSRLRDIEAQRRQIELEHRAGR